MNDEVPAAYIGRLVMKVPESLPLGAEWLLEMPQGQAEEPPPGTPAQPVQEFHRRTVTGRTSGNQTQVVEWLYASIEKKNRNSGTQPNQAIRKWVQNEVGLPEDNAGHIIAKRLGGLGTVPWNIFPQSSNFNSGVFKSDFEETIYNATAHGVVRIWFRFYYDDLANPGRPGVFNYYVLFPNGSVQCDGSENPYKDDVMGSRRL